jgi:hypothetical protein
MLKNVYTWLLLMVFVSESAQAQFTPNNLVVIRLGDGLSTLSSAGTLGTLVQYTTTGSLVSTVNIPTTDAAPNYSLVFSGTATSDGQLKLSADRQYLTFGGYNATTGTASVSSSTSDFNRTIARVGSDAVIDTRTIIPSSDAVGNGYRRNNFRSVVSNDGSGFWCAGNGGGTNSLGGTRYVAYNNTGSNSVHISSTPTNTRVVNIFNGQLYTSSGSGSNVQVNTVGTGLPTNTGNTTSVLNGLMSGSPTSPYDFIMFDLNGDNTPDVMYLCDDAGGTGGIYKYSYNGTTWTAQGSNTSIASRSIAGRVTETAVELYFTSTTSSNNALYKLEDSKTATTTISGASPTILASAGTNYVFRGVAFTPNSILPVELTTFNAKSKNQAIHLLWQTASEKNNAYFNIQRSRDGQNFEAIGQVKGAGNSQTTQTYQFIDAAPLTGLNYYRLEQVDFDGTTSKTAVKSILWRKNSTWTLVNSLVKDEIALINTEMTEGGVLANFVDITGKVVLQKTLNAAYQNISVSELNAGLYFIQINENAPLRFFKQ